MIIIEAFACSDLLSDNQCRHSVRLASGHSWPFPPLQDHVTLACAEDEDMGATLLNHLVGTVHGAPAQAASRTRCPRVRAVIARPCVLYVIMKSTRLSRSSDPTPTAGEISSSFSRSVGCVSGTLTLTAVTGCCTIRCCTACRHRLEAQVHANVPKCQTGRGRKGQKNFTLCRRLRDATRIRALCNGVPVEVST